jgi:hypothetical protein
MTTNHYKSLKKSEKSRNHDFSLGWTWIDRANPGPIEQAIALVIARVANASELTWGEGALQGLVQPGIVDDLCADLANGGHLPAAQ